MGTTMTVALVEDGGVTFGHVGDSRAYLLRDGELEQLTDDHSLVAELVRSGKLSPEEAEDPPAALGDHARARHRPGRRRRHVHGRAAAGRRLPALLRRAHDMVDDDEILELVERHRGDLDGAAKALVERARTGAAARTTSPSSPSRSTRRAGDRRHEPATSRPRADLERRGHARRARAACPPRTTVVARARSRRRRRTRAERRRRPRARRRTALLRLARDRRGDRSRPAGSAASRSDRAQPRAR